MSNEVEVKSLGEFANRLSELSALILEKIPPYHRFFLFRGQSNKDYEILPSIERHRFKNMVGGGISIEDICSKERNLIANAKNEMPEIFKDDLQPIDLLALLQHHGTPTRLLDLTRNAMVALYFACVFSHDVDGEVIAFLDKRTEIDNYPIVNAIADSYRFTNASVLSLPIFFDKVTQQKYFSEQQITANFSYKTDEEKSDWIEECCKDPIFIHSKVLVLRQRIQQGGYILFPNKIGIFNGAKRFISEIEPISKDHECIVKRFIIPAKCKEKILEGLSLCGINRGSLFADSPDIVCEEIRKEWF